MTGAQTGSFGERHGLRWALPIVVVTGFLSPITSGYGQTSHTYTAETEKPAQKKGAVTAGALKWECLESRCTIIGPWPSLGVGSCQALARAVGPIKSFGRPGAQLDAAELGQCNTRDVVVIGPGGGGFTARAPRECSNYGGDCDEDGHNSVTAIGRMVWSESRREYVLEGAAGDDCDDNDRHRYPGNTEVCDPDGHDEDCNPETVGSQDDDGDGHIDTNCINTSGGVTYRGDDCDDTKSGVHHGSPEVCNGFDDDCDRLVDAADALAGLTLWVWEDRDNDGFGNSTASTVQMCPIGDLRGFSINNYDCDDSNSRRHPGAGCP